MCFLWILITLLVLGISGTQVFTFFYVLLNYQEEYKAAVLAAIEKEKKSHE